MIIVKQFWCSIWFGFVQICQKASDFILIGKPVNKVAHLHLIAQENLDDLEITR